MPAAAPLPLPQLHRHAPPPTPDSRLASGPRPWARPALASAPASHAPSSPSLMPFQKDWRNTRLCQEKQSRRCFILPPRTTRLVQ